MNISLSEDLAIIILSELALSSSDQKVPLSDIAKKHALSPLYLKKIIRVLRQSGLVDSKEGSGGGYSLAVSPDRTTLWDIYRLINRNNFEDNALDSKLLATCPVKTDCLPQIVRKSIRQSIKKSLENLTLASILKGVRS